MPFVLSNKATHRFKVVVKRPNDATGTWDTFEFLGEFKRLSQPEIDALFGGKLPGDSEVIERYFVGWDGVKQPDGAALEVNEGNQAALLAEPGVRASIVKAFLESTVFGPAKN